MGLKQIIRKNLRENHDLMKHSSSIDLLTNATNSLADSVRYLETLVQKVDNKECSDVLIKILDILRHPMGNSASYSGFNSKDQVNILSLLEIVSGIISREKMEKRKKRNDDFKI